MTDYGYKIEDISLDLHADETDIVETEYEKAFKEYIKEEFGENFVW